MKQSFYMSTPDAIVVPPRLRSLNEESVATLMQSIDRIGLRTPITVRWDRDEDGEEVVVLVAGRHRLEACKRLGIDVVNCVVFDGTDLEAKLWEIAENLHRADLTVMERSEHIAEWVKLTAEKVRQVDAPSGGKQPRERGVRKAAEELGVSEPEVRRAEKIANISAEAKAAAANAGIADNQSALLAVADAPSADAQLAEIQRRKDREEASKRNRSEDRTIALDIAAEFATWLNERIDQSELPMLISWLECCKPRDVITLLRRQAA